MLLPLFALSLPETNTKGHSSSHEMNTKIPAADQLLLLELPVETHSEQRKELLGTCINATPLGCSQEAHENTRMC